MEDYITQLFPYVPSARIKTLSCGHVIPDSNLLAWPVGSGPSSYELDFTYEKRGSSRTITTLGECVLSLARIIPDGVVVFFPSYAYLEQVITQWKSVPASPAASAATDIWSRLTSVKPIFAESKTSSAVDDVLSAYSAAISSGAGALLLSVVGGKMSEGINFSDSLGRGVVIVGLPFPNAKSVEWAAKMSHIKKKSIEAGATDADAAATARAFYENACMRAVNQSIGRAIRHRGDYACIAMLDRRYGTRRIQDKLPEWIKRGLVANGAGKEFREVEESLKQFFARPR